MRIVKIVSEFAKLYASKKNFTALAKNPLLGLYEIISIKFTVFIKLAIWFLKKFKSKLVASCS